MVIGLIHINKETSYRTEISNLFVWCINNCTINVTKTKELTVNFRKNRYAYGPIHINGLLMEIINNFKFLDVQLSDSLSWSLNTSSKTASNVMDTELSSLQHIFTADAEQSTVLDALNPAHVLCSPLPSGKCFHSIKANTTRLKNSFFPEAVRILNS